MDTSTMPKGLASPMLPLCLNCAEYILDLAVPCPHCAADPTRPGGRYKDEGFYARDALERLLEVMERAMTPDKSPTAK